MNKNLHLTLKYHWYDEIESGKKNIEYRDNTPYWRKRIIENNPNIVIFHKGYTSRIMKFEISRIIVDVEFIEIHLGDKIE